MRRTPLIVVAALVVAACSGDDGGESSLVPPSVVTTSATQPTTPVTAAPTTVDVATTIAETTTTTSTTTTTIPLVPLDELGLEFVPVAQGFAQPVYVASAPGDPRLFVLDQPGVIWLIDGGEAIEYLDIRDQVNFGGERGLLGLAFHPEFATNQRFFVYYIDNGRDTVVAEYRADGDRADASSEGILLTIAQPAGNHNGGMIDFGPDGHLWIGTGDGGGANDQYGHGQRTDSLLAAMLRIDVDGGEPYAVPADNPFLDGGGAAEVWAYGLRNPWRWAFDGDRIVIGDVGQNRIEEIDVASVDAAGLNYGWPITEGSECFRESGCDTSGQVLPVVEYTHADGCSVTGGFVYRGGAIPELNGHYFYGDYCRGWVSSVVIDAAGNAGEVFEWFGRDTLPSLTSFGVDGSGELYATTAGGTVWKLQRTDG